VGVDVDLGRCVAGGYWIVRPARRPPWCDPLHVADPILSCSGCLLGGAAGPEASWSATFDETAAYLGVAADDVPMARAWVAERDDDVGWVNTWPSPGPLLEFVEQFIPDGTAMVLGVALSAERARAWVGDGPGDDAIEMMLARAAPPEPGGVPIGWEPVEWLPQGVTCSWTCNLLQPLVAEQIELRLTDEGLLPDQAHTDEVMRIVEELPKEDGPWEAFLLVRYGAEPTGPFRELPANVCELPAPLPEAHNHLPSDH
jgi:hypothetical protein